MCVCEEQQLGTGQWRGQRCTDKMKGGKPYYLGLCMVINMSLQKRLAFRKTNMFSGWSWKNLFPFPSSFFTYLYSEFMVNYFYESFPSCLLHSHSVATWLKGRMTSEFILLIILVRFFNIAWRTDVFM